MPKLNEWDFNSQCADMPLKSAGAMNTYSVGIFQWKHRAVWRANAGDKNLMRGYVRFRIRGFVGHGDLALRAAKAVCDRLNKGKYVWFDTRQATVRTEDDIQRLVRRLDGKNGKD